MRRLLLAAALAAAACSPATPPAAGGPCRTAGGAACDADTSQMLQCDGTSYLVFSDCKGPGGCRVEGETVNCDTTGNTAGDRCAPTSEGKVRCEPNGGDDILRCLDGGLTSVFTCPTGTICGLVPDAGLTCI
ncbi:MAG: hypothetical protein IT380_10495 [Myxococcales bacterium]|nr:hypothetical protein [Myxococcales bacterium]